MYPAPLEGYLCLSVCDEMASLQMLVRAHVAANTTVQTLPSGALSGEELQEGLMAGFDARARRKHVERHAARSASRQGKQQMPRSDDKGRVSLQDRESIEEEKHEASAYSDANGHARQSAAIHARDTPAEDHESSSTGLQQEGSEAGLPREDDANLMEDQSIAATAEEHSLQPCKEGALSSGDAQLAAAERQAARTSVRDLGRGGHFWHGER